MAVNVSLTRSQSYNRTDLLAWLNEALQINLTNVEQACTGAAYCQLMDQLFPGSVNLSLVHFQSGNISSSMFNFRLLQNAFKSVGVVRYVPTEALIKGNSTVTLTFLHWFKKFFDENNRGRKYNALEARGGQSIFPSQSGAPSNHHLHQKRQTVIKRVEGPKKEKPTQTPNKNADVISLISDDEHVVVKETAVNVESVEPQQITSMEQEEEAAEPDKEDKKNSFDIIDNVLHRRSCGDKLDTSHREDVIKACSHTPYCLYLYVSVELDEGQRTSVVLIGYFDQSSGVRVVSPLLALQMSFNESQISADSDTVRVPQAAESDARLLIEALETCGLSLSNLAVFYCDAPHPGVSQVFVSHFKPFSPRLISLCGLPGMAGRACQAGLLASFSCVVDLVRDIHHHYSACSTVNDSLKELFAKAEPYDPSRPISTQSLFIIRTVQKMVSSWRDLVEYFKSLGHTKNTDRIRTQLLDKRVKLHFLFLCQTLEPLRAVQQLQQDNTADVATELQLTAILVHTYAASILKPLTKDRFVRKRDVHLLHSEEELLPEVDVGTHAGDFLWATPVVDLGEQDRKYFKRNAQAFYKAALQSLVESLPEQLGDVVLRNISTVLKHPETISGNNLSSHMLPELGVQLGLCNSGSPQTQQLGRVFLGFIHAVKEKQKRMGGKSHHWTKMLHEMTPYPTLHVLLLTLLALPTSLHRKQVFAEVSNGIKVLCRSKKTSKATSQPDRRSRRPCSRRRKLPVQESHGGKKKQHEDENEDSSSEDSDSSSEDSDRAVAKPVLPFRPRHYSSMEDSDLTDNSSDVLDVTEEFKISGTRTNDRRSAATSVYTVSSDEEDDRMDSAVTPPSTAGPKKQSTGELVWGRVEGLSHWPAITIPCTGEKPVPNETMVRWYGQAMTSKVATQTLKPFASFCQHFCANSFSIFVTYREAILMSLQEAAVRCKKKFPPHVKEKDELLKLMLDWAFGGFQPLGPDGLKPTASLNGVTDTNNRPNAQKKLFPKVTSCDSSGSVSSRGNINIQMKEVFVSLTKLSSSCIEKFSQSRTAWEEGLDSVANGCRASMAEKGSGGGGGGEEDEEEEDEEEWGGGWAKRKSRGGWKGGRGHKKKWICGFDDDMSPNYVPPKRKTYTKSHNKVNQQSAVYEQPDQKLRGETIRRIMDMKLDIEGFCLCCGTEEVEMCHPLFKGSLCLKCKNNFAETLYRYDEDGYQSYCTICCYGMEVILCGNDSCCRSYCGDCLDILVGPGTFESLKLQDPWICYMCQPHQLHGALVPRDDWSIRVQELFANNSAMAFEPHRVYPSIPANLRRPVRVLSLFDGIATGYLVLKELGFKVEKYVASEVCEDSVAVATVNHEGKIIQVGDVRSITQDHINEWGPFDLLIGGSPCNDLSIVNPIRKGLYEGTGRLFFDYYRILQLLKPKEDDRRPFFWLFENVVFMNTHDKVNICRFLECNPVLVDAIKVSPAHRARYFWGNIPGMSRPIIASQNDKLNLQDCLEIGREARMTKVRTITTNANSLKQGKHVSLLPVLHNGREETLWITELEKIFGFPKHYTDVRNMNRQQRQKVLGKAWSVPVIRHLFAPLKDYFACEELPPMTTTTTTTTTTSSSSSSSSTRPSSPASPEVQLLR